MDNDTQPHTFLGKVYSRYGPGMRCSKKEFLEDIFASYIASRSSEGYYISDSVASRWLRGKEPVSYRIVNMICLAPDAFAEDIRCNILPKIDDVYLLTDEIMDMLYQDSRISQGKRAELEQYYRASPPEIFLSQTLIYVLNRVR